MIKLFRKNNDEILRMFLRLAIGTVFLWFGIDKWIRPEAWFGWVPEGLWPFIPMTPDLFMELNGIFEFMVGTALIANVRVREAAAAASLFLFAIMFTLGANEIGVRDNALLAVSLALFVDADSRHAKPWLKATAVSWIAAGLTVLLFVYGVMYLRAG